MIDFSKAKKTEEGYLVSSGEAEQGVKPGSRFSNYQIDQYVFAVSKCKNYRRALDIGACYGIMSIRMANDFVHVESFEPLWYEFLEHNTANQVNIHKCALGKHAQTVTMRVGLYNSGGSNVTSKQVANEHYQLVDMKTLDSFEFTDVDFVKMDVEGHEWPVIEGGLETFKQCNVFMVEINRGAPNRKEIYDYFKNRGFIYQEFKSDVVFWKKEGK